MNLSRAREKEIRAIFSRQGRRKSGKVLIEGVRAIDAALKAGVAPEYFVVSPEYLTETGQYFRKTISDLPTPLYESEPKRFDRLSDTVHSQGLLAVVGEDFLYRSVKAVGEARFVVYLDGIADPGNLGTIIRTAAAFAVDLLALSPECADIGNPKVLRASAGFVFSLPIRKIEDPEAFFLELEANKIEVYGCAADSDNYLDFLTAGEKVCLAIGSEARGLSESARKRCKALLAIKMASSVESLNVAAAAAIAINSIARKLEVV
ncbi:MAG: RNA methyltransferase [candidate division Zixibacteria bacterium]|nr:RNA methyltransferase [candidate division Zixibacteria bacterium]